MTTRKSIAEQVLRIVNGGDVSDDSRIEFLAYAQGSNDAPLR